MNENVEIAVIEKQIPKSQRINQYHGKMVEKPTFWGKLVDVAIVVIMFLVVFISIIPIWHVLMSSFSDGKLLLAHEGLVVWPVGDLNAAGYARIFSDSSILKGYLNTIIYVVGATIFCLILNITAGYVLSRRSMLRGSLTIFIIITMMFNGGLIPTYMVIRSLGWVGKRWAILIPGCTNAIYMLIMAAAFRGVPESTVEAARIDGAGHLRIMTRIMLPQCLSIVTVIVLFSVVQQWNSWYPASIYLSTKRELWPLQLWIKQIVAENQDFLNALNPDYNRYLIQYSVIIAATLPILMAFPFFQKYIEKGVLVGGIKE